MLLTIMADINTHADSRLIDFLEIFFEKWMLKGHYKAINVISRFESTSTFQCFANKSFWNGMPIEWRDKK